MEHEIVDLGLHHEQYFQGAGVAFTDWDIVFVGIGSTPHKAADDAIEQAALANLKGFECIENTLSKESQIPDDDLSYELWHYVALYMTDPRKALA
jgi:hypothetical protein